MTISYTWRGEFSNGEVNALHAEAFEHEYLDIDWSGQLERYGLGWVCARSTDTGDLVGFVKVIWDGDVHAFVLDTMVSSAARRRGVGTALIEVCVRESRAAGCEWLHFDFEPKLREFYFDACGFRPTDAGLIALR